VLDGQGQLAGRLLERKRETKRVEKKRDVRWMGKGSWRRDCLKGGLLSLSRSSCITVRLKFRLASSLRPCVRVRTCVRACVRACVGMFQEEKCACATPAGKR
jgi:hypothetical protein